jgi:polysaccharide pyruvyl transferase WcaK-like protein
LKNNKNILVIGNYNAGNIGDDLLLESFMIGMNRILPDYHVKILAPAAPADYYLFPTGIRSFFRFKWIFTLINIRKYKYLIFGGGGIINPEEFKSIIVWGFQIVIARFFGLKIIFLANSFSNLNSKLALKLIGYADFITCRDSYSYKLLNRLELDIPIRKTMDLSFLKDFGSEIEDFEFDSNEFIVLNLRKYKFVDFEVQKNLFLKLINEITRNSNFCIYLMPFDVADVSFLRSLSNLVKDNGRVFLLPFESDVILSALRQSKLVISQRLHPLLVSINMGKNCYGLSYSSKVLSLLEDLGFQDNVYNLRDEAFNIENFCTEILNTIANKNFDLNSIDNADYDLVLIKKQAEDNFRLLNTFLN